MDGKRDYNLQREIAAMQSPSRQPLRIADKPLVAAAVHSPESLRAAERVHLDPRAAPDLLELRVDCFTGQPDLLNALAAAPPRPLVVTVRRSDEGGADPRLDDAARARLYARFLPTAAWVDVEASSLEALAAVLEAAQRNGTRIIVSCHDFQGMPTPARLRLLAGLAVKAGADVFKVAAVTNEPHDLARLLDFLAEESRLPLAVMGMGRLGQVSRVALAAAGSVLNYGYLGASPQVPGQWPAAILRERIDELETATTNGE